MSTHVSYFIGLVKYWFDAPTTHDACKCKVSNPIVRLTIWAIWKGSIPLSSVPFEELVHLVSLNSTWRQQNFQEAGQLSLAYFSWSQLPSCPYMAHLLPAHCLLSRVNMARGIKGRLPGPKSQLCQATCVTLSDPWCLSVHIYKMGSTELTPVKYLDKYAGYLLRVMKEARICHPNIYLFDIKKLFWAEGNYKP